MIAHSPIGFAAKDFQDLSIPHQVGVNPFTGAATVTVGIPLTPGRSDFQPALSLLYNSSAGNSPYGMGWALSGAPVIALSLKDGLPNYDTRHKYTFGGAELTPWLERVGNGWAPRVYDGGEYWIHLYRSQAEEGYVRFEKWVHKETQLIHWRSRDRNNTISIFGKDEEGRNRIYDPGNERRIFSWLIEAQYDRHGNAIHYEFLPEDGVNVATNPSFERDRLIHTGGFSQRYLKRIRYGNMHPLAPEDPLPVGNDWAFEAVFDYGEHIGDPLAAYDIRTPWPSRADPFSSYRAGFEIRTYRLCRRILMFHHFSELGAGSTLVGTLQLEHQEDVAGTTVQSLRYTGIRRDAASDTYAWRSLPPLRFRYSQPQVGRAFFSPPTLTTENAPYGIGGLNYRWIDLHGEGLPGILFETNQAWYFKPNLGGGRLGAQRNELDRPAINPGEYAISDFDGDGNPNLVVLQGRQAGYYEYRRDDKQWTAYQAFSSAPHVKSLDATTQLLDLNGDGRADIVTVDQERITWYPSKGKEGFGAPVELAKARSNGRSMAPTVGANPNLNYFFADMTGDGRPDQVRICNGRVEYWPQLGNGQFGGGVVMEDAPLLDFTGGFDASRVRLVDLDGSGTADLVYIGRGEIKYWINASGNRFAEGATIRGLPYIDNLSSAQVLDFLGDGTPCLVWSSSLPNHGHAPLQYLPLAVEVKPRLLLSVDNAMGREVQLAYGHSASHYLRDEYSGQAWITKLPQHVTVVDRLEVIDHIGNTRFESLYEYHDGFFDSEERTFRGFGMVDQFDSDSYQGSSAISVTDYTDPVCVRTWFHNGASGWDTRRRSAYYQRDLQAVVLPLGVLEEAGELESGEYVKAFHSLAGRVIRTEVYGLDRNGNRLNDPYEVTQNSYGVRRLQPKRKEQDPCFTAYLRESLSSVYEQAPSDPRINHALTLAVDGFGNVTEHCTIAYPRRSAHRGEIGAQERTHIGVEQTAVVNVDEADRYQLGLPLESKAFEVAGLAPPRDGIFLFNTFLPALQGGLREPISFEQDFTGGPQARLMRWNRFFYWDDVRTTALPWGELNRRSLLHHQESAAFSATLFNAVFADLLSEDAPRAEGRYRLDNGYWWQAGPTLHYLGPEGFNLLFREERLDGGLTDYTYDAYRLTLTGVADHLDEGVANKVGASIDYHVMAPYRIVDPNENIAEVRYDPLGMIVVSTSQGRLLSTNGRVELHGNELLSTYRVQTDETIDRILAEPARFLQGAGAYTFYDLESSPLRSVALVREELVHDSERRDVADDRIRIAVSYIDGFGRALQTKTRVEAGLAIGRDERGQIETHDGVPILRYSDVRWRASGRSVFNNKQKVVRQYEPFFSPVHSFESDEELQSFGETTLYSYDPLGRLVQTVFPNLSLARTAYTPWETQEWDANDTVAGSGYALFRGSLPDGHPERQALREGLGHQNTPRLIHYDPLGREVAIVEDGRGDGVRRTATGLDYLGAPRTISDPRGLIAFIYRRDMLGRALYERSIDAGEKWTFPNALGQPVHHWDGAGVHQQPAYDRFGRVTRVHVEGRGLNQVTERFVYGEDPSVSDGALRNARGQLVRHYDQAGVLHFHRFDPAGNPFHYERQLAVDYATEPEWSSLDAPRLEESRYETRLRYDALGQVKEQHLPDGSIRHIDYLQGGEVQQVRVTTADGELSEEPMLRETDYNARGQRTRMVLGNGVEITYEYDRETYRMNRLFARRLDPLNTESVRTYQDIRYTYDPVGNITHLIDLAQQRRSDVIHDLVASSHSEFTYDAFYQLRMATGRIHEALQQHDGISRNESATIKGTRHVDLNNGAAVRRYTRDYQYDLSGNLQRLAHRTLSPDGDTSHDWHTDYWISSASNRSLPAMDLHDVPVRDPESRFDANGNCLYLAHLRSFVWNYRNNLARAVVIDRSEDGRPNDEEHYVYGGDGMRVRKVTQELVGGDNLRITEKIYLDGCEIKRVTMNGAPVLERTTSHISDGSQRIALLYQWGEDAYGSETDDIRRKKIHYQLSNHLGSASLEVDEQGSVITYEEYFPFGGTAFIAGSMREVRLKEYRYSGKERDDATGLYCYGYRYYAPWLGRWISPDPIGPEDGVNLYGFVRNNPVNFTDPDGLQAEPWELGRPATGIPFCIGGLGTACPPAAAGHEPHAATETAGTREEPPSVERPRGRDAPSQPPSREEMLAQVGIITQVIQEGLAAPWGATSPDRITSPTEMAPMPPPQSIIESFPLPESAEDEESHDDEALIEELAQLNLEEADILSGWIAGAEREQPTHEGESHAADSVHWFENPELWSTDRRECVQGCHTSDPEGGGSAGPQLSPQGRAALWVVGGVVMVGVGVAITFGTVGAGAGAGLGVGLAGVALIAGGTAQTTVGGIMFVGLATGAVGDEMATRHLDVAEEAIALADPNRAFIYGGTLIGGSLIGAEARTSLQVAETTADVYDLVDLSIGVYHGIDSSRRVRSAGSHLSDWNWEAELGQARSALGHDEGMLAVGRTDIPGLEAQRYAGASTRAGGPVSLGMHGQPTNPQGPTIQFGGGGRPHAEGDVANQVITDIETLISEGSLREADLEGRTIMIPVEQHPCPTCRGWGHYGTNPDRLIAPGSRAWMSALVQLSYWYPRTDVIVVFPGGRLHLRAGRILERIGVPGTRDIRHGS